MFTQFFGNYLLNNRLVAPEQLAEALAVQKQTRPRLGVLAINAGYMTAEQVDMVHAEQQRVDKRIGDIAVDMGFLTRDQVEELLSTQGAAHLQLGQALVNSGAMTNAAFADALNNYKSENSLTDVDFGSGSEAKIDELIKKFYSFDSRESEYITDYITLLFKNIIRFIGDDFTPMAAHKYDSHPVANAAIQNISGVGVFMETIIAGDDKAYITFASRYAEEELTEVDEMVQASCGEFINLHNGLYTVNISNVKNKELKLSPQEYFAGINISGISIPLVFPFGTIEFIIKV